METSINTSLNNKPVEQSGFWFFFEDSGKQIAAFGSFWSGREQVYFDGELVSDKRTWGFSSDHQFQVGDNRYRVTLKVTELLKGTVKCELFKNERAIGKKSVAQMSGEAKPTIKDWLMFFVIGMVFGVVGLGAGFAIGRLMS